MTNMGESILDRSPNEGRPTLREAIRQHLLRNRGIVCDTEQIFIGSGSEYLYTLIVELLGRDRIYGIESPSYKKLNRYIAPQTLHMNRSRSGMTELKAKRCGRQARIFSTSPHTEASPAVSPPLYLNVTNILDGQVQIAVILLKAISSRNFQSRKSRRKHCLAVHRMKT